MSLLITGASGFLGAELLSFLSSKSGKIYLLLRPKSLEKAQAKFERYENIICISGDIRDNAIVSDPDAFSKIKSEFPADHTIIRNSAISYFRTKDEFEINDFLSETFNNYSPIDPNLTNRKIDDFKNNAKELPQRWGFDNRFTIEKKEVKKRVVNTIQLTDSIDLVLKDYIPNLKDSIKSEIDNEGTKWVKIKSDDTGVVVAFDCTYISGAASNFVLHVVEQR